MTKKRAKPFAANNASVKALEASGWTVGVVETRIPHCFITRDLYGFADLIACSPSRGVMLVQVTGGTGKGNFNARVAKTLAEPRHAIWLASGGRIQIHSWETVKGSKQRECRVMEIQAEQKSSPINRRSKYPPEEFKQPNTEGNSGDLINVI